MGRKAKAGTKPLSAIKSPSEKQKNAVNSDLPLSKCSHYVKKKLKAPVAVRRSVRFQSPVVAQEMQPVIVIDEKNLSESPNQDEPLLHEQNHLTEETTDVPERSSMKDNLGAKNAKYKTMYTRSQIKMEALIEENKQLTKALEHANGKIDVYEKHSGVYSEVMAVIASLSRANEHLSGLMKPAGAPDDGDK